MKNFLLKLQLISFLIAFFGSFPVFGSDGIFDCDLDKLKIIDNHINPYLLHLQEDGFSDNSQQKLYGELIRVRNGEILEGAQCEVLVTLMTTLPFIITSYDNLDERATLNLANAKYYLAESISTSAGALLLYQDSYYLYSLLVQRSERQDIRKAAGRNMDKLLREEKIRCVTR